MEKSNYIFVGVDPQNDFIDGSLAVAEAEQIIKPINSIADEIREHDGAVVFTRDWHPEKTPHFDKWPVHCVANTRGADFHEDLNIQPDDIIINKGTGQTDGYSGWEGRSDKDETLESIITPKTPHEKVKVFLGGLVTDFCVKSTALDIAEHFKDDRRVTTYLLIDAIRAVGLTSTAEEESLSAMKEAGILAISTEEAKKMIQEAI
jgi:nicotinamidase/pyrazinamidase